MAGIITALAIQKNDKERVNVYLDGDFAFGVTLNVALSLKKGQYLDDDTIAHLKFNDDLDKAYQRTLRYLSYRPRTQQEVKNYLQDKGVSEEVIELVTEQLISQGYLDDYEFGRIWVENRTRHNPKGRRALQYELRQKGLAETEIDQVLSNLDEEALAWQAVRNRLRQWQGLDEWTFRKKLTGYLVRRGFDYEIIEMTFTKAWQEQQNEDDLLPGEN